MKIKLVQQARTAGREIIAFVGPHEHCGERSAHRPHKTRAAYPTVRNGWQQPYCDGGHAPLTGERDLYGLDEVYFALERAS